MLVLVKVFGEKAGSEGSGYPLRGFLGEAKDNLSFKFLLRDTLRGFWFVCEEL